MNSSERFKECDSDCELSVFRRRRFITELQMELKVRNKIVSLEEETLEERLKRLKELQQKILCEMRCCSIKLAERNDALLQQFSYTRNERYCFLNRVEHGDDSSRFSFSENSKSETESEKQPPRLAVLNISIPKNMKAFNTGSSLNRWTNKRPRLKSAKSNFKTEPNLISPNSDHLDVPNLVKIIQTDYDEEIEQEGKLYDPFPIKQIDPDIQRLLEETHVEETQTNTSEETKISEKLKRKSKRKYKKKLKEVETDEKSSKSKSGKTKKKLTKVVSFSLSKPPTPQTKQVIRVDIISNHSIEIEEPKKDIVECNPKPEVNLKTNEFELSSNENENLIFKLLLSSRKEKPKDNFVVESKRVMLCQRE